jgi:hypothetical protein|nr:MAG TPA: hypothetical protein [Caudoviricetes sp.]
MEYRLFDDKGAIFTRTPEVVSDMLYITFEGAPAGATAIFERDDGFSAYKLINDGVCGVEGSFLKGTVRVTVAVLNGRTKSQRWFCEGIYTQRLKSGEVIVSPADTDLQKKVLEAEKEIYDLKTGQSALKEKFSELEKQFTKLLEGYDIV